MKRALVTGLALLSTLSLAAVATAQEPAPPSTPLRTVGRFQQLPIPTTAKISNLASHADPNKVVSATVVLQTESVSAAQTRAERFNQRFDRASSERAVRASQESAKPGLRAAGARLQTSTTTVLNAVTVQAKVKDLPAIAAVPGVASVHVSRAIQRFNGVSDLYTGAADVWDNLGYTGAGMKIAVIDDGIDYYHADFGGSGDPADYAADDSTVIESGTFPTAKVVGGYDFVGDHYDANADQPGETDVPAPDPDPLACGEHGTHVSGTAAGEGVLSDGTTYTGPYDSTTLADHTFNVAPGSAPEASILIYKVFGCDGSVNDDVLLGAIDMAVANGASVINMSLGSDWGTADEPLAVAIDNATQMGVLSVVSAGNAGPNAYLVGGPSTANTALSVAAIDASSTTLPGVAITGDVNLSAQNSNAYDYSTGSITGLTVDVGLGCDVADYAAAVGKIAVSHRGVCDRVARAINGTTAGALAVIFINNADGYPPVEGAIPGGTIPFVGLPISQGAAFSDGMSVTLSASSPIPNPAYSNFASFTSNGPRQDSAPKPDISAPGVNILSAFVGSGTQGTLLSGTSMAAPHTAGIAVLVRQAHPTWGPIAVKGAMMSTADPTGVGDYDTVRGGTGLVTAPAAVDSVAYFSTADGSNNLAFGFRQLTGNYDASRSITITNTSSAAITYDLSTQLDDLGLTGFSAKVSPSSVKVPAGSSRNVTLDLKIKDPQNLPEAGEDAYGALPSINGLLLATPRGSATGVHTLRAPVLLVPYGVSDIQATGMRSNVRTDGKSPLVSSIRMKNSGVHFGTYDTYQWIASDRAGDNGDATVPDVRDVGVQQFPISATDDLMVMAISTNNRFTTFATAEFDVYADVDGDGNPDYVIVGVDNGLFTGGAPDGQFTSFVLDLNTSAVTDVWTAFAPANGSVVEMPWLASDLGATGPVTFWVEAYTVLTNLAPDLVTPGVYDPTNPAVSMGDFDYVNPKSSTVIPTSVDVTAARAQGALGWLVVSVDDAAGSREADRVPLRADGDR